METNEVKKKTNGYTEIKVDVVRYYDQSVFPKGEDSEKEITESLSSAFVYTSGMAKLNLPGVFIYLGPQKGEYPSTGSQIVNRSRDISRILFLIVTRMIEEGFTPKPGDCVIDEYGRRYIVEENEGFVKMTMERVAEVDDEGAVDFQSLCYVFVPMPHDDYLTHGKASRALH